MSDITPAAVASPPAPDPEIWILPIKSVSVSYTHLTLPTNREV